MADAPFGKLKNMLPAIGSKKEELYPDTSEGHEDNSRGQKVNKKQHDVLLQLNIKAQTELDNKVLTPSKVKTVGFHTNEDGGYSFKEVEEFHDLTVKTVDWYANKLFERDNDVRKLATEVDKYITDFQNMKIEIELLTSEIESKTIDEGSADRIDSLEEKILRLERENSTLKSQNELLKSQASENQDLPTKEENPVNGQLTNSERQHLQELESWAAEVTVLYDSMETALEQSSNRIATLESDLQQLATQAQNTEEADSLRVEVANMSTRLQESEQAHAALIVSYGELQEKFTTLEAYSAEIEAYGKAMDDYVKQLMEEREAYAQQEPEAYVEEPVEPQGPSYNLPEGVSLDDL